MEIRTTQVSKCLDKKLKVMGFEVIDLFALFLTISVLNFIFGNTSFKIILIWAPSLSLAFILFFGKKGKPDNYLIHWLRYQFMPAIYSAFYDPKEWNAPPSTRKFFKNRKH